MTFIAKLWRVELSAVIALLVCAFLLGIYGFVDSYRASVAGMTVLVSPLNAAWSMIVYVAAFGVLPVVAFGAPLYAMLNTRRVVSWPTAILLGVIPGVSLFFIRETELAGWFVGCGVGVATLTHLIYTQLFLKKPASD